MIKKEEFDYYLPQNLIAQTPAVPRDSSKLFIYQTKTNKIFFDQFYHLDYYLPLNSFLVLNNTKVIPARVVMRRETGGKVEVVFLKIEKNQVEIMVDRKVVVGEKLFFDQKNYLDLISQEKNIFSGQYNFSKEKLFYLIHRYGSMPVPLYLRKTPLSKKELRKKYQTIFGKKEGSAAAPTASLHFTHRVFKRLEKKGIKKFFITLHVGLGTFAPLTKENLKEKKLHKEYYQIEKKTWEEIIDLKNEGKKLVAVGTTVTRALETLAKLKIKNSKLKIFDKTDLFIFPPFDFKMIDILITNFHLPQSSLMMLVEAFLRFKKAKKSLVELYNMAIKNNFRFYSFGDAMVIL